MSEEYAPLTYVVLGFARDTDARAAVDFMRNRLSRDDIPAAAVSDNIEHIIDFLEQERDAVPESPNDTCCCLHSRAAHIYEVGACRPGFVCETGCIEFKLLPSPSHPVGLQEEK